MFGFRRWMVFALTSMLVSGLVPGQRKPANPQVEAVKKAFKELLDDIDQNKVDARSATLRELVEHRAAVAKALDAFRHAALNAVASQKHAGIDYVRFVVETAPRLSGGVVRVGPNEKLTTLAEAAIEIEPGDLVVLGEGVFTLPQRVAWRDVAFVGRGAEKTKLQGQTTDAQRVRIANVRVECRDMEFINLVGEGSIQMRDCYVTGYNSGAGGSNAVYGSSAILLFEGCTFEGMTGRAGGAGRSGGNAFDLRGSSIVYVRNTKFVDNSEILRATNLSVFDGCESTNATRWNDGITPYRSGCVLLRANKATVGKGASQFLHATDDTAVVRHLQDATAHLDPKTRVAIDALGLGTNLRYWAALLRHPDPERRQVATGRLSALLQKALPKTAIDPKVAARVPKEMQQQFARELRSSILLTWLDEHKGRLKWNAVAKRYEIQDQNR